MEEDEAALPDLAWPNMPPKGRPPAPARVQPRAGSAAQEALPHNATTGYEELLSEGGPRGRDGTAGALQGGLRRSRPLSSIAQAATAMSWTWA